MAPPWPDAPVDLQNIVDVTDAVTIGLIWTAADFDGGTAVIDFRIWYDNATNGAEYVILAENILQPQYISENMVTGSTY